MSHTLRELVETLRDGIMLSHNDVAFCNLDAIAMAAETAIRKIRAGDEEGAQ